MMKYTTKQLTWDATCRTYIYTYNLFIKHLVSACNSDLEWLKQNGIPQSTKPEVRR